MWLGKSNKKTRMGEIQNGELSEVLYKIQWQIGSAGRNANNEYGKIEVENRYHESNGNEIWLNVLIFLKFEESFESLVSDMHHLHNLCLFLGFHLFHAVLLFLWILYQHFFVLVL